MPVRPIRPLSIRPRETLYHVSRAAHALGALQPLSHLGTLTAARHRALAGVMVGAHRRAYAVRFEAHAPLRITDYDWGGHSPWRILDHLHYDRKVLSAAERERVFRAASAATPVGSTAEEGRRRDLAAVSALVELLAAKGVDALAYANGHEDPGQLSWVLLRPDQATILGVADWGVLTEAERATAVASHEALAAHWASRCPAPDVAAARQRRALRA